MRGLNPSKESPPCSGRFCGWSPLWLAGSDMRTKAIFIFYERMSCGETTTNQDIYLSE